MKIFTPTGAIRAWATILMLIAGFGLALGLTIGYVNKVDNAAEKRNIDRARDFCAIIRLIDDRNQQVPPKLPPKATPEQKEQFDVQVKFVAAIHDYRVKLGC